MKIIAAAPWVKVSADGHGVVSHAGIGLLRELADRTGLSAQVSAAVADTYRGPWVCIRNLRFDVRCRFAGDHERIFERRDPVANQFEWVAADRHVIIGGIEVHTLHDPLDDPAAVIGIHDVEAWPKTRDLWLDAQLPCAEAVERADNSVRRRRPTPPECASASRPQPCW